MECGHMGDGNSKEIVRYLKAADTMKLFEQVKKTPGLKSKGRSTHISLVKLISQQEFEAGRVVEWKKQYITG